MSGDAKTSERAAWDDQSRGLKFLVPFLGGVICVAVVALFLFRACKGWDALSKLPGSWGMNVNGLSITTTFYKDHMTR